MITRWARLGAALAASLVSVGCGKDESLDTALGPTSKYHVTIRETSYGVPHVLADDLPSAAAGLGYVGARDYGCILLDQIVRVKSERAKFFGAGTKGANVDSDFAMLTLHVQEHGTRGFEAQSPMLRGGIEGYVAGFNHYLETAALAAECAGKPWVRPLTGPDLFTYYYWLAQLGSAEPLFDAIGNVVPYNDTIATAAVPQSLPDLRPRSIASNGWAIGSDKSATGRGMLLANPHFPWEGNRRFYESHITVTGMMNVYGASLLGVPVINIGFNEHLAWTHTVTTARHFTLYKLTLSPSDPLSYQYDGAWRRITTEHLSIDVLQPDGSLQKAARTMYRSHYGPILNIAALGGWSKTTAWTFRNANEENFALGEQWLRMDLAQSLDEFRAANDELQGIPWVNTMSVDAAGNALYMDASRTPNLSDSAVAKYRAALANDVITQLVNAQGATLLDGSSSEFEWVDGGRGNGAIVPFSSAPQLERKDFVFNANDSYWLTNPTTPLTGYSPLFGSERTPPTPRTRMNLLMLTEARAAGASGADGKFDFSELSKVEFNGRASLAEVLVDQVLARCSGVTSVTLNAQSVNIASACDALRRWDRRLTLHSAGTLLWREFLASFSGQTNDRGKLFADAFDPNNPVTTPNTIVAAPATGDDPLLVALGSAVLTLSKAGLSETSALADAQHTIKGRTTIPVPGGTNLEGAFNIVGFNSDSGTLLPQTTRGTVLSPPTGLTEDGYIVNNGSSFMMALEFTNAGPHAQAVLSYSQSADASSPHLSDQTRLFSEAHYRDVAFTENAISSDPELHVTTLDIE